MRVPGRTSAIVTTPVVSSRIADSSDCASSSASLSAARISGSLGARAHVRGRARGGLARRGDQQLDLRRGSAARCAGSRPRCRAASAECDGAPQHDHQQQRHACEQHVLAREDPLEGLARRLHGTRRQVASITKRPLRTSLRWNRLTLSPKWSSTSGCCRPGQLPGARSTSRSDWLSRLAAQALDAHHRRVVREHRGLAGRVAEALDEALAEVDVGRRRGCRDRAPAAPARPRWRGRRAAAAARWRPTTPSRSARPDRGGAAAARRSTRRPRRTPAARASDAWPAAAAAIFA